MDCFQQVKGPVSCGDPVDEFLSEASPPRCSTTALCASKGQWGVAWMTLVASNMLIFYDVFIKFVLFMPAYAFHLIL